MSRKTTMQLARALILSGSAAALVSCGAPTKSAGEVAHLFGGESETLQNKVNVLCTELNTRDLAPSFKLIGLDADGCRDAGRAALNLNSAEKFYFAGLESDGAGETEKNQIIHKSVRGQVWLNKSLVGLASAFAAKLKAKSGGGNEGLLDIGGSSSTSSLSNIVKPEITIIEEPKFDLEAMKFSAKIHVKTTGAVEVDNEFVVDGELLNNSIVATLSTTSEQVFEKSLINTLKAGVLIVPHASDVYVDIFFDLKVNSPGVDGVVSNMLDTFLSTGLKQIIDSLLAL